MVALTEMVDYQVENSVAVITVNNPPVNALSQGVRQGLMDGVAKAQDEAGVLQLLWLSVRAEPLSQGLILPSLRVAPKSLDCMLCLNKWIIQLNQLLPLFMVLR